MPAGYQSLADPRHNQTTQIHLRFTNKNVGNTQLAENYVTLLNQCIVQIQRGFLWPIGR